MNVHLDRKEAVALLKELSELKLIHSFVLVQQKPSESYKLQIKGEYETEKIKLFLDGKGFSVEENDDCLIISKP